MRSYSSLLCHLLASNQDISGYSEKHLSYESMLDFRNLRRKVHAEHEYSLNGRYVLDKILHDKHHLSDWALNRKSVIAVFMIRRPEDTLKSLVYLGTKLEKKEWGESYSKILQYYVKRLDMIAHYSDIKSSNSIFIEAENIINDTEQALKSLSEYLSLRRPLLSKYSKFKLTGKPGRGDSSEFIKEGFVRKQRHNYEEIIIPSEVLEQAQAAYKRCYNKLEMNCLRSI